MIGGFLFMVAYWEALWCCQWHLWHLLTNALQMRQFSFNLEEVKILWGPPFDLGVFEKVGIESVLVAVESRGESETIMPV